MIKRKWYSSLITNSVTSYDLPKLKKRKKPFNSIRLTFVNSRNSVRKELDFFHRINLFEKYNKNFSQLFLTNQNQSNSNNTLSQKDILTRKISEISLSFLHNHQIQLFNDNKSPVRMYFSDIGDNKNSDYLCQNQSTTSLVYKTKSIMKSRYIRSIQVSHYNDLLEEIEHQNLEFDLKMYHLRKRYQLLIQFLNEQMKYIKYLNQTINEQKVFLVNMEEKRQFLEKETKYLRDITHKKQNLISKAIEYKEFLLKVKYLVPHVKEIPNDERRKYSFIVPEKKSDNNTYSMFHSLKSIDKASLRRFKKRNSILKTGSRHSQTKSSDNYQRCQPIFCSTEEFNEHLKRIEKNSFELFQKYGEKNEEIIALQKESRSYALSDLEETNQFYLDRLKEEKDQLIQENKRLNRVLKDLTNSMKKEDIKKELIKKLKDIVVQLPIDIENEFNENNFYHIIRDQSSHCWIKGKSSNILVYLIQVLEKILLFYMLKIKRLKRNSYYKGVIHEIKKSVEKRKKIMNNKRNREIEIEKRRNMYIKIMIKNTKVHLKKSGMPNINSNVHKRINSKDNKQIKEQIKENYEKLLTY